MAVLSSSDIFYQHVENHWKVKTPSEKKKIIEQTLKKLHRTNAVIAGKLTLKEQIQSVYAELEERGGWKENIWLKIYLGVKAKETDLGLLLTHGKFTEVCVVFAGPEAFDTTDKKLFHFEGKDEDEQLVYVAKQDIKPLSYSNYCHWSEKYKLIYREILELPSDFDEQVERETTVIKISKLQQLKEKAEKSHKLEKALTKEETKSERIAEELAKEKEKKQQVQVKVEKQIEYIEVPKKVEEAPKERIVYVEKPVPAPSTSQVIKQVVYECFNCRKKQTTPDELDKLVYTDFYEFKDPFLKNFWFLLKPGRKIELARHAKLNGINLEAATRLFRDVKNAF